MKALLKTAIIFVCAMASQLIYAEETDAEHKPFHSRQAVMADVQKLLATAKAEKKRALLVIGANWCHDSRSMASKLAAPEMADLINKHYKIAYINVGYFDEGMNVSQKFGVHTIYGTPTVMVIDPKTNHLVNHASVQKWRDASKVSLKDTVTYFTDHAAQGHAMSVLSPEQKIAKAKIDMFEKIQGLRLRKAYHHVGPLLRAYKEKQPLPKNFRAHWDELAEFRYTLTKDMKKLRDIVHKNTDTHDIVLPKYTPFSWEK